MKEHKAIDSGGYLYTDILHMIIAVRLHASQKSPNCIDHLDHEIC